MKFENAAHKKEFLRLQAGWKKREKELKEAEMVRLKQQHDLYMLSEIYGICYCQKQPDIVRDEEMKIK